MSHDFDHLLKLCEDASLYDAAKVLDAIEAYSVHDRGRASLLLVHAARNLPHQAHSLSNSIGSFPCRNIREEFCARAADMSKGSTWEQFSLRALVVEYFKSLDLDQVEAAIDIASMRVVERSSENDMNWHCANSAMAAIAAWRGNCFRGVEKIHLAYNYSVGANGVLPYTYHLHCIRRIGIAIDALGHIMMCSRQWFNDAGRSAIERFVSMDAQE